MTPSRAASAAVTPASAAWPACSGFDIESMRNACCSPAEKVATVASACAKRVAIELEQLGRRGRGAEAADGAGVVPVLVVGAAHRGADAGRDLVPDDHRAQERFAARAPGLRERERGRDRRRAGVVDAVAEDVVDLDRVRGRAVDQRRGAHGRAPAEGEARRRRGRAPRRRRARAASPAAPPRRAAAPRTSRSPRASRGAAPPARSGSRREASANAANRSTTCIKFLYDGSTRSASRRMAGHSSSP